MASSYFTDIENNRKITIGIVTYNSEHEISMLMESIQKSNYFNNISTYVVDNGSIDNTVQILKSNYPWVNVYKSDVNLGFGKAHNIIINHVHSKYHLIINPDVQIEINTIELIDKYMDDNDDINVCTPYVKNIDGSQQYLPKKNPTLRYLFAGLFEKISKKMKMIRDDYTMKNVQIDNPIDVEFCSGCFMITKTRSLHQVKGFDESFFLHFEDADLTRKLRKTGRAVFNPNISITHKWERDNRKFNKSFWIALKSMIIYLNKWK